MDGMQVTAASDLSLADVAAAFNAAFEGYAVPMRHTEESFAAMVHANDIHLGDSLIARGSTGTLLGIALLGVRGMRGWIGGMAIVPDRRGQGIGTALLTALIARSRMLQLDTLHLEVLDQNAPARHLYARLGFRETRPLVVYAGAIAGRQAPAPGPAVTPVAVAEALARFEELHPTAPPWQRELPSLLHMAPTLSGLGIRGTGGLRAYLLWMPSGSGYALLDFGSRPAGDATAAGDGATDGATDGVTDAEALIAALHSQNPGAMLRAINVAPGDPLGDALAGLGCGIAATQREMVLRLE
jgi:ribosomal protein S18 acetylase RimI-like enzyme